MTEPDAAAASAGALLRAAREKQGLHIAALAAAIKVAPRKLDALEHDRWDELPDATFTRALAQTVCRTLKIDSRPVLELLPPSSSLAFEAVGAGLNAPFRDRPGREEPGLAVTAIRPMVWAASLLMVAAVAVYFVPEAWWKGKAPVVLASSTAPPGGVAAPAAPATATMSPPAELAASAPPVIASAVAPAGSSALVAAVVTPAAAPAEPVVPPPPAETAAPAGVVQLRASDNSWIEARDARGQLLLSRIVAPGERVGLDGSLPIRLTIGNAAATQLGFRGQAVDLGPSTRDNVARVELK